MPEKNVPNEAHVNPFRKLSELFKKRSQPTENRPAVQKPTRAINKPEETDPEEDSGSGTMIWTPTGMIHYIPHKK